MTRQRRPVPILTVPQAAKCAELMERFEAFARRRDASDAIGMLTGPPTTPGSSMT